MLDINHRPVFCLKDDVSETGFWAETETSSIYWAQMSRFHLRAEMESSLWNVEF
jgi:hypothetical protein